MGSSWWRRRLMVLLILCVLQPMLQLPISRGCFPEERAALMEIRASLLRANCTSTVPPPPWGDAGGVDCCSWKRVRCSNFTRRISHLFLSRLYVRPASPDSGAWSLDTTVFAAFHELQYLDLSYNSHMALLSFDGLKNLSNLRELDLSDNRISGNLPSFLFSLPHIEVLNLTQNMIEGPIPISSSSNLSLSLRSLCFSYNNLSGRLSFFWWKDLVNLMEIDLSGNADLHVNVNIPKWVPRFQLKQLYLSGCNLDKSVITKPKFLATQHHLEDLDLSGNNFSVGMPNWLFAKGLTLGYLNLANNSLTGSLEPIWYPQTYLYSIFIGLNHISGPLPANISSVFPSLDTLDVSNNNFSGEVPMSLCHIKSISSIELSNNNFSGELPACVFDRDLPDLHFLSVSNNHLGGPILGRRSNLTSMLNMLKLDGNKFEGTLPRNLSGEHLVMMDLHDNKLTGELDPSSWSLSQLMLLDVSGNYMIGEIQPQIYLLMKVLLIE